MSAKTLKKVSLNEHGYAEEKDKHEHVPLTDGFWLLLRHIEWTI
jgi:hypothetical protein